MLKSVSTLDNLVSSLRPSLSLLVPLVLRFSLLVPASPLSVHSLVTIYRTLSVPSGIRLFVSISSIVIRRILHLRIRGVAHLFQ